MLPEAFLAKPGSCGYGGLRRTTAFLAKLATQAADYGGAPAPGDDGEVSHAEAILVWG